MHARYEQTNKKCKKWREKSKYYRMRVINFKWTLIQRTINIEHITSTWWKTIARNVFHSVGYKIFFYILFENRKKNVTMKKIPKTHTLIHTHDKQSALVLHYRATYSLNTKYACCFSVFELFSDKRWDKDI